jgi:1-deoxy-D-xylulose-5-phosphate synthase
VVEDNLVSGGVGAAVTLALREADVDVRVHTYGIPKRFLEHASRGQILEELGLTADQLVLDLEPRL